MPFMHEGYNGSSFIGLLKAYYPDRLPRFEASSGQAHVVGSTTIVGLKYLDGVILAGDRRATLDGHFIMNEYVTKVFKVDDHSAMAIAGVFGPSVKMVRLFQTEIEHYEKTEGVPLTLEGKSNKLSTMIEQNFPAAIQGLPILPLFAGYDIKEKTGKIFEYDITGGTFVIHKPEPYSTSGSGGERAGSTFEHFYREGIREAEAMDLVRKALSFAAKKDAATGGKHIVTAVISAGGVKLAEEEL
jgi:proteasome beta subunit